jgi:hypothetical protein
MLNDYPVKSDSAKLLRDMHRDLQENLRLFKRVQGGAQYKQADDHFYQVVMPNHRIEEINKLTGANHPLWGTWIVRDNNVKEWYGCDKNHFAYVGLRFAQNMSDWLGKDAGPSRGGPRVARPKPVRLKDSQSNIVRPQILVTIRPESTYKFLRQHCTAKSGVRDDQRKFVMRLIEKNEEALDLWEECTLVPLKLFLPTRGPRRTKGNQIIKATHRSMHYDDNQEVDKGQEVEERESIIETFRNIALEYRRTRR